MNQLTFISFETSQQGVKASLSVQGIMNIEGDVEPVMYQAVQFYEKALGEIRALLHQRKQLQKSRKRIPARLIWRIGDVIFKLNDNLSEIGLQIDNTYYHLTRDLAVKRKWIEKVVVLRRYVQDVELIPESANWGTFEKGTRKKAQLLLQGK